MAMFSRRTLLLLITVFLCVKIGELKVFDSFLVKFRVVSYIPVNLMVHKKLTIHFCRPRNSPPSLSFLRPFFETSGAGGVPRRIDWYFLTPSVSIPCIFTCCQDEELKSSSFHIGEKSIALMARSIAHHLTVIKVFILNSSISHHLVALLLFLREQWYLKCFSSVYTFRVD